MVTRVDESTFEEVRSQNKINIKYAEYREVIKSVFKGCADNKEIHNIKLFIDNEKGYLEIYTKNELRTFLIMSFDFVKVSVEQLRTELSTKYIQARTKKDILEERYIKILKILKTKDPRLFEICMNLS